MITLLKIILYFWNKVIKTSQDVKEGYEQSKQALKGKKKPGIYDEIF